MTTPVDARTQEIVVRRAQALKAAGLGKGGAVDTIASELVEAGEGRPNALTRLGLQVPARPSKRGKRPADESNSIALAVVGSGGWLEMIAVELANLLRPLWVDRLRARAEKPIEDARRKERERLRAVLLPIVTEAYRE